MLACYTVQKVFELGRLQPRIPSFCTSRAPSMSSSCSPSSRVTGATSPTSATRRVQDVAATNDDVVQTSGAHGAVQLRVVVGH